MTKSPITSAVFLKNKFLSFLNTFFYTISKNEWLLIVFVVGIALRLVNFGFTPGTGAVNQDETFAGYESLFSIKDWHRLLRIRLPIYFVSWGSSINVLESYLIMPSVAFTGLKVASIRLLIIILSIFSLFAFYGISKRFLLIKFSVLATFIFQCRPMEFHSLKVGGRIKYRNIHDKIRLDYTH